MLTWRFLHTHWRELGFGFLLCLTSSFGQTFFISLFGGEIRATFAISDGAWGSLYSAGTIASAVVLIWSGRLVDRLRLAQMSSFVLAGLAAMCVAMSLVWQPFLLVVVIFGLRQFGQGLSSHTGITAMARRFTSERGRAVSVASLGLTFGEALLPLTVVAVMAVASWRGIWLGCAVLLLASIPLARWLVAERHRDAAPGPAATDRIATGVDHTLSQVLREPSLWLRAPALLAPSFVFTGLFLHQVALTEAKGWPMTLWASGYLAFALCSLAATMVSGLLVDRYSARRLVSVFLTPLALACLILWQAQDPIMVFPFMALMGVSAGVTQILLGSLWSELYGVRHIGAIRAFGSATMVLSTGLAPALFGLSMDAGTGLEAIALMSAAYCLAASVLGALAPSPRLEKI